ncbi:hypothetical protein D3C83_271360 [compost metagenome]
MPVIDATVSNLTPAVPVGTGAVIGASVPNVAVGIFMTPRSVFDISRNSWPSFL